MQTVQQLANKLDYLDGDAINQVVRAYHYAEQAHDGQKRRSGEPYITHPLAVSFILSDMFVDHQSLMAALLHDVIEDTPIPKSAIATEFGDVVADLVDGVSKLTQIQFRSQAEAQAENFQKMTMAMAKDIRVILVKLADRLHNMKTLGALAPEKQQRIAKETLDMYAPIANRLGMHKMMVQFEDLCFEILYPMRSKYIRSAIKKTYGDRQELFESIKANIEKKLKDEGIEATIIGREKHLYSIYKKMQQKNKSFADITDMYGYRVIVKDEDMCYRALGAIHRLYKPVPGYFKDYIAIPKSNGYRSLHTVLFGSKGIPVETQIRTEEMERLANNGIAAHWLYKAGNQNSSEVLSDNHMRAREWVQGLLEMQQRAGTPLEFIEHVKIDLFPDEVYVFTPKGKILELPQDATPIDFAYAVHTDIGNHCVSCRINKKVAPLSQPLQSGQTVEIITSQKGKPSPHWLDFVVTGKARSNIRHAIKNQRHNESIDLGKRLLNKALHNFNLSLDEVTDAAVEQLLKHTGHNNFEFVLEDIGLGNRTAYLTARQLLPSQAQDNPDILSSLSSSNQNLSNPLMISGTEGMVVHFARCCHPLPGEIIAGRLTAGEGIIVHRNDCININDISRNGTQFIPLQWAETVSGEFHVELRIEIAQQHSVVIDLATKVDRLGANIEQIDASEKDGEITIVIMSILVGDRIHLARIMKQLRTIKTVRHVSRIKQTSQPNKGNALLLPFRTTL